MISPLLMLLWLTSFVDLSIQLFHKADPSIQSLGTQKMQNMQLKAISEQFNLNHQTNIFFFQQYSASIVTNFCNHKKGILQIVLSTI